MVQKIYRTYGWMNVKCYHVLSHFVITWCWSYRKFVSARGNHFCKQHDLEYFSLPQDST